MNTPETYPTIEAAVAGLQMLLGTVFLGQERRELRELITANGLSRRYVADLAEELVTELGCSMPRLYTRHVMRNGIISIDDELYQVSPDMEGQKIIVDPDSLQYRTISIREGNEPIPGITPLQPGLLTAREIIARYTAREDQAALAGLPADRKDLDQAQG